MKVAYIYAASASTDDQYQAVVDRALHDGKPAGLVLHVAGRDHGGRLQILEVWDSDDARNRFGEETLFPILKELGIDVSQGPEPVRLEVTNLVR